MESGVNFCVLTFFISEEVILSEERTTDEEKLKIIEGNLEHRNLICD